MSKDVPQRCPSEWIPDTQGMSIVVPHWQSQQTYQCSGGAVRCAESAYYMIILNVVWCRPVELPRESLAANLLS